MVEKLQKTGRKTHFQFDIWIQIRQLKRRFVIGPGEFAARADFCSSFVQPLRFSIRRERSVPMPLGDTVCP